MSRHAYAVYTQTEKIYQHYLTRRTLRIVTRRLVKRRPTTSASVLNTAMLRSRPALPTADFPRKPPKISRSSDKIAKLATLV